MNVSRRRRRTVLSAILVVIGLWVLFVAARLVLADHHLHAGVAAAKDARAALSAGSIADSDAPGLLALAQSDFRSAHDDVASVLLAPLRVIPVLDTQLRSISALSASAADVSADSTEAVTTARHLLNEPHTSPAQRTAAVTQLASVLGRLQHQVAQVRLGPSHGLIGALAKERATFAGDLAKLRTDLVRAHGAAAALTAMFRGPSTYLVVGANNAEMRAGSGMALEVGTLSVRNGALHLEALRLASTLVTTSSDVKATGDIEALWGFENPTLDFRELLLSPQFPANAALAAQMWKARTGQTVDGVLLLDDTVFQDLLGVTGPVQAGSTTLDQADALHYLLEAQYAGLSSDPADSARHQELGLLAAATFARLEQPGISLTKLASALDEAADGRHLLAWASDPAVEADWVDAGVGGAVSGDDLLLSLLNQGGNKLDPYQQITSGLQVTETGGRSEVTDRVTVKNVTPPTVTGFAAKGLSSGPPPREYAGALELDFPRYAGDASVAGDPNLEAAGADYGADVLAVPVTIPDGQSVSVTFHFVLAGTSGTFDVLPSARVPAITWEFHHPGAAGSQAFTDASAHSVRW